VSLNTRSLALTRVRFSQPFLAATILVPSPFSQSVAFLVGPPSGLLCLFFLSAAVYGFPLSR